MGERRGQVLADMAIGRMRAAGKLADLSMALAGRFTDHHALLCRLHLDRIAVFDDGGDGLDKRIAEQGRARGARLACPRAITAAAARTPTNTRSSICGISDHLVPRPRLISGTGQAGQRSLLSGRRP